MIVKTGPRTFELRSIKTGRVLGTHPSYARALRQERAIEASKHRRARQNPTPVDHTVRNWAIAGVALLVVLAVLGNKKS